VISLLILTAISVRGPGQLTQPVSAVPDTYMTWISGSTYQMADGNQVTWNADPCPVDTGEPISADGSDDTFLPTPPTSICTTLNSPPQVPQPYGGTGPYRRVLTKPGFYGLEAHVKTPPDNQISPRPSLTTDIGYGDTPYLYLGGWGANRTEVDSAIDAGLIFNYRTRMWDAYMAFSGRPKGSNILSWPVNIPPGETTYLGFATVGAQQGPRVNQSHWAWLGVTDEGPSNYSYLFKFVAINALAGWTESGANCYLKRMTSIAQVQPEGSAHASFLKQVKWSDLSSDSPFLQDTLWSSTGLACAWVDPASVSGYSVYPKQKSSMWLHKPVTVTFTSAAQETVKIVCQ